MKNLCFGCSTGKHIKDVFNADAHPTNARTATALARIESYSIQIRTHLHNSRYFEDRKSITKSSRRHLRRALQPIVFRIKRRGFDDVQRVGMARARRSVLAT